MSPTNSGAGQDCRNLSPTLLDAHQTGKEMLVHIMAMLTKLVERFDPDQCRVRENASGVAQSFEVEVEVEHEHEHE